MHYGHRLVFSVALAAPLLVGCYQAPQLSVGIPPALEADSRQTDWVVSIPTTFRNPSRDTVLISLWSPILERFDGTRWRPIDLPGSAGFREPTWLVAPRDSLQVEITKEDSPAQRVLLRREPVGSGEYRLALVEIEGVETRQEKKNSLELIYHHRSKCKAAV
jgi:hypothetical protein